MDTKLPSLTELETLANDDVFYVVDTSDTTDDATGTSKYITKENLLSGLVDGSGTTNELAYWVDSDTLGALAVATYPSLTELSYVKGVTSAIQTQINAKQDVLAEGAFVDGDKTKLDGIETGADVTDTANVTSAGALMDSEVTNLADVKAFDTTDYATSAQGATADSALQDVVDDTTPQLGGDLDLNGNELTGVGAYKVVYKSADETVNNSTTLQDDDHLLFAVGANEVWAFEMALFSNSDITPDLKSGWSVPASTTMIWGRGSDTNALSESDTFSHNSGGVNRSILFIGTVFASSTPGNVQFRWAQNTADLSDTKVLKGSYIIAHRLA